MISHLETFFSSYGRLSLFVISSVPVGLYGYRLAFGGRRSLRSLSWLASWVAVLVVVLIAADFLVWQLQFRAPRMLLPLATVILMIAIVVSWNHLRCGGLRRDRLRLLRSPTAWIAFFTANLTCGLAGLELHFSLQPSSDDSTIAVPGRRNRLERWMALTDMGRELALYEWVLPEPGFDWFSERSERLRERKFSTIRREAPHEQTNCHGWVFTKGRHLLFGPEVQLVLEDNGYLVVETPAVNDLIIYRAGDGTITHSGLVQAILADGSALIESKWGISSRCLHFPKDQPFGENFAYYRSRRTSHAICLIPIRSTGPTSFVKCAANGPT